MLLADKEDWGPEKNVEGLTYEEWINAANFGVPRRRHVHGWSYWREGCDPTEFAADWYHTIRRTERVKLEREIGWWHVVGHNKEGRPMIYKTPEYPSRSRPMTDEEIKRHMEL